MSHKYNGPYERFVKRPLDCILATGALIVLSPVMGATALLVKKKHGSPVLFRQERPGMIDPKTGKEKIFRLYKFCTMTDERDAEGNLTPLALTIGYPAGNAIGSLLEEYMAGPLAEIGVQLAVKSLDFGAILSEYYGQTESTCDLLYLATNFDEIFDPSENFRIEQDEEPVYIVEY